MHGGSSSELLLDAKCRQLLRDELAEQEQRRRKLLELGYSAAKRRPPRRTCKQRLTFYATSSLALVAISGGCALLFLVPLYVDPAISTLTADFFPEPVICTTSKREDLWGLFNCTWSSCREGCTSEVYRCTHIYVTYTPWTNSSAMNESELYDGADSPPSSRTSTSARRTALRTTTTTTEEPPEIIEAVLLVNIKGCGYPPIVDCENFTRELGYEGSQFPCYYSRVNGSIVMAEYDRDAEVTIIMHYFAAPLVMTLATTAVLCVMHCDCRCQPPPRRYPPRRITRSSTSRPNDLRYWWLCFYVGECRVKGGFRAVSQD